MTCVWVNPWKDSGDRGAARCDHDRECHPDHEHVWGDSTYDWEQVGTFHYVNDPDNFPRAMRVERTEPAQRCTICALSPDRVGECRP